MKIATWNVNGLRARLDFVRIWLQDRQPDAVGIQECKVPEEEFPYEAFEEIGYHAVVHAQKAWNGVAILSREPCEVLQAGLPGQGDFGARLVTAMVGDVEYTTVYCPNGKHTGHEDYPRKLAWYDSLLEWWQQRDPARPALIGGDFNICVDARDSHAGDSADGDIFHTVEERSRMQALFDTGLIDLQRHLHPDFDKFSWWDYRGGAFHRNLGLRIDLMLGTPALLPRVQSVEIDRDYRKKKEGLTASDHAPVIVDLT